EISRDWSSDVCSSDLLSEIIDGRDVGVVERRTSLCLAHEPLASVQIGPDRSENEFQRHGATEPHIFRPVYGSHAALTQFLGDPVMGDCLSDHSTSKWVLRTARINSEPGRS